MKRFVQCRSRSVYHVEMDSRHKSDRVFFCTTNWTLIAAAAGRGVEANSDECIGRDDVDDAMQRLCQAYWYPIYSFVRHTGCDRNDAEDLTQAFFTKLLEKDYLADADRTRGRFRTFMLASLKHFMANERDRSAAIKRGGRVQHLSLDFDQAEARYRIEPVDGWTADAIYERNWAISLLREVLESIAAEYQASGKGDLFAALSPHLTRQPHGDTLAAIAEKLETTTGAVKVAAYRLRSIYRKRLIEVVKATVDVGDDVDAERRLLLDSLAGGSRNP